MTRAFKPPRSTGPAPSLIEAVEGAIDALTTLLAALRNPEPSGAVPLVSLKEAARHLGVHERTLRRRAKAGEGVKVGGVWRFDVETLRKG